MHDRLHAHQAGHTSLQTYFAKLEDTAHDFLGQTWQFESFGVVWRGSQLPSIWQVETFAEQ